MKRSKWPENEVKDLVNINENKRPKTKEVLLAKNKQWKGKGKAVPLEGLDSPRGFHEVKVPRFHDSGTGWW